MYIRNLPQFSNLKITGLDIGCSGFKPKEWDRLESKLQYYGVDPLVNEINKLQLKFPKDAFLAAFVADKGCKGRADAITSKFFSRTSAAADMNSGFDLIKENFNSGQEVKFSSLHLTASELLDTLKLIKLDLLKIDVDGDDFALLKAFLNVSPEFSENLLAFEIESQFHGDSGEYGNNFGNILQLANAYGFYLYKLDSYTYSRNELRKPYVHDFPAQTHGGQVLWGDALFVRDGLDINDKLKLQKIALILEAYDLEDCAFEILSRNLEILGVTEVELSDIKAHFSKANAVNQRKFGDLRRILYGKMRRFLRG